MGTWSVPWAIKNDQGGSKVCAWFGIKAVLHTWKTTMVMIVLRASLHQIGHYGGLDIASPQSGHIVERSLPSPHFGGASVPEVLRIDIASQYCFGPRRRSRLCLHLPRDNDLTLICELVRSHQLKSALGERVSQEYVIGFAWRLS